MPTTDRKLRVFLCHSSQDKPIVRELYQRLLAEGWIDPWLDEEKLLPGQNWEMEIEKAVEATDSVVLCLSTNSVNKEGYIQKEIRKVLDISDQKPDGTIFVIPLRLDNCQPPTRFKALQYVDYFPNELKTKTVHKILRSLDVRLNTLLPVESMENIWVGNDEAFGRLSQQEKNVLLLVSEGKNNRQIASTLFLGEGTVRNYVKSNLSKLGLNSREEAAEYAIEHNLKKFIRFTPRRNSLSWSMKKNIRIVQIVFGNFENEYVEIENPNILPVNMTNWVLCDVEGNKFKFPPFILQRNNSVKIWTKDGQGDQFNLYWARHHSVWSSKQDTVVLEDNDGSLIDSYSYTLR